MAAKGKTDAAPRRWREGIEAIAMAVVVALLFKYFILEVSKIPSGSMQPTLMGSPEASLYDRVLVDKLSYRFRDPERFEIVVFRHPLEQSRVMVKRLVGMPGEELEIRNGDLWVRPSEEEPFEILRRPEAVQRTMWRRVDPDDPKRSNWTKISGNDWRITGRDVVARGEGSARFRADAGPILDAYSDGYPEAVRARLDQVRMDTHPVGDLRLEAEARARGGLDLLTIELTEGMRTYEFHLPGPAATEGATAAVRIRDGAEDTEETVPGEPFRLPAEEAVDLAVENLDDRLRLFVDGRELLVAEVAPSSRQEAWITVGVSGEGADLEDLAVYRDVYYLPGDKGTFTIPEGHYVMLGDNTQDSADSRDWKSATFEWSEDGKPHRARGNSRLGRDAQNPVHGSVDGAPWIRFRDLWGEEHWFPRSSLVTQSLPGPAPLVSRDLVQGRAIAVFWPIKPAMRLWRLGWLF